MVKLKTKRAVKKFLAFGLSAAMILSLSSTAVLAADTEQTSNDISIEMPEPTDSNTGDSNLKDTESKTPVEDSAVADSATEAPKEDNATATAAPTEAPKEEDSTVIDTSTEAPTEAPKEEDSTAIDTSTEAPTELPKEEDSIPTDTVTEAPKEDNVTATDTPTEEPSEENSPVTDTVDTSTAAVATAAAIGTKITVGSYVYKVTSANTVTIKGFAENVSATKVIVKNKITYNGVTYNVIKVGNAAFQNQISIKQVVIRKSVADIGKNAFNGCINMTKVTIRTGATIIRKKAFMNCIKLKTVNITSTVLTSVKTNAFKNIQYGAVINVMNKSVKKVVEAAVPATVTVNKM